MGAGGVLLGCLPPPPKAKKLTLQVYRPRNQNQNLCDEDTLVIIPLPCTTFTMQDIFQNTTIYHHSSSLQ